MPVLLLAQGDPQAKDLLRKTIQARYGLRPPALDSLQLDLKGRVRAKLGPITTWVPVEAGARFQFPGSLRWDFSVKAVGVQIGSGSEAFDGTTYRVARGSKATVIENSETISSLQRRLWAMAAIFLTPLGEQFVKLNAISANQLEATNTQINSAVKLNLRADNSLESVEVECLNPDSEKNQLFKLVLSEDQNPVNDMMLPCKISAFWDNNPYFELEPTLADSNVNIPVSTFTLETA